MPGTSAGRPIMPVGYGIDRSPPTDANWAAIVDKIAASRSYWICTTRDDGRPHAIPVWGVVIDDALMFSTDPKSTKGRNLTARNDVVVHLESGDDVVIIEGRVERVADGGTLTRFADAYNAKYEFRPDPADPNGFTLRVRPNVVLSWLEADFPKTAVRWKF